MHEIEFGRAALQNLLYNSIELTNLLTFACIIPEWMCTVGPDGARSANMYWSWFILNMSIKFESL